MVKPCLKCGQDVIFRHINGVCTPIHRHGMPCGERAPYSDESLRRAVRCRCPVCRQEVYLVRHNGGRFWVNELGWPWPPHPCFGATTGSLVVPPIKQTSDFLSSAPLAQAATIADFEHALYLKLTEIPVDHRRRQNFIHDFVKRAEFENLSRGQMESAGVELLKEVERPAVARGRQRSMSPAPGRGPRKRQKRTNR